MGVPISETISEQGRDMAEHHEGRSLITTLGLVEGDILSYMERYGACTLRELTRSLDWPSRLVMMAVGALVRDHILRAMEHDLEIVLMRLPEQAAQVPATEEPVPEVWGG